MGVRRLYWTALAGRWRAVLVLAACSLLEGVPAFLSGRLVQLAVDEGFAAGAPGVGLTWLGVFAAVAVAGAMGSRLVWRHVGALVEPMRDALVARVVRGILEAPTPPRNQPDASGVARLTQHVEVVRDATAGLLVQTRGLLVTTAGALLGVVTIAGPLGWLVTLPVVVTIGLFACLLPSIAARQRAVALADEGTAERAGTIFDGMRDVVACGGEQAAAASVSGAIEAQARAAVAMARASALRSLVIAIGGFVPLVLVLAAAPGMVAAGELSAGAALGSLVYLTATLQPALQGLASAATTVILRLLVALRRLAEVADLPPRRPGHAVPVGDQVVARGVTFRWGAGAEPIVHDLDLTLAPGEHLAVVGPSGIGKSTVAGLLTGMLAPDGGVVILGGMPVREVNAERRHRMMALVPQEAYLFTGTVRENLALFAPDADDARLWTAVEAVGAADLIARLGGLDAELGHGATELSAGERQLLALARIYAHPAPIVILDEATSHLDPATELRAERAFAARSGTLVVIAHRPASALRAHRILVMDGADTTVGTHDELLTRSPRYAELFAA
ncbi:ABC transporter ATP-binding protein [Labedaea rhizosphaerae]|uniref:ABC transporter ATP-binding protein n=1 Tax=Labedaea rhizosphaerae TaxID=598644 RepID=UPI00105D0C76|nr:ABC transporter ATP-binding protein [Labedaea rhizosphaerae]